MVKHKNKAKGNIVIKEVNQIVKH